MNSHFHVFENFFAQAEEMRQAIDAHFAEPYRHGPEHQVWNYWFVPQSYTYMRSAPEKVVGQMLAQQFFEQLEKFAFETFGLATTTWPFISLYVDGCHQQLHNDAKGGRLGFFYSLTRWEERNFGGGETLLFHETPWQERMTNSQAGTNFFDLVPQNFNQLLLFDDRIPHAVPRLEGTMNPVEGRIVIHGHLSEGGLSVDGDLSLEEVRDVMAVPLAALERSGAEAARHYHGLLIMRLHVGAMGRAQKCEILLDRVLPRQLSLPPFDSLGLAGIFADCHFAAAENASRVTIPLIIGGALPI